MQIVLYYFKKSYLAISYSLYENQYFKECFTKYQIELSRAVLGSARKVIKTQNIHERWVMKHASFYGHYRGEVSYPVFEDEPFLKSIQWHMLY